MRDMSCCGDIGTSLISPGFAKLTINRMKSYVVGDVDCTVFFSSGVGIVLLSELILSSSGTKISSIIIS